MDLARDIRKAYQELDLTPGASLDEVRAAYRRLARALHPDLHPGTLGALMSRVNQAYDKLVKHLEGDHPHQAGPAQPRASARKNGRDQAGFRPYRYEEFSAPRGARGEYQRRNAAWQEAKRRFYEQALRAAAAATRAARQAAAEPQSPPTSLRRADEPLRWPEGEWVAAGPVEAGGPSGWRLLGLVQEGGALGYRVEVRGRPHSLSLPVRCCRTCRQCEGSGRYADAWGRLHRCPACGGRGRITRADRVRVELPPDWRPGQRLPVPACGHQGEIIVELLAPREG